MAHFLKIICAFTVLAALSAAVLWARHLPLPRGDALNEQGQTWCGVLRMWVCEGWEPGAGSLVPWLSAASSSFERKHDGVYVQITPVTLQTMRSFNYAAENPPDLILFHPGAFDSPDDLLKTEDNPPLNASLHGYGGGYALPVAMGGYALIDAGSGKESPLIVPTDAGALSYSAATAALLVGDPVWEDGTAAPRGQYGVDLGLPSETQAPILELAAQRREIVPAPGSARAENAYAQFTRGEISQTVVTQREIRKLQLLDDAGRAPDWRVRVVGETFSDQLALVGVVDIARDDLAERQSLALAFRDFLLSDAQQAALAKVRAFRVTPGSALYAGQKGFSELEAALAENPLVLPDAFGNGWRARASDALDALLRGEGGAKEKIANLFSEEGG